MITRAHIRRQLRKNGGIMNVTPRQAYGLGSLVKSITKPFKKVLDVGKQVIKSPIGKAALIGLGGAGLMGMGPLSGLSGIGARIGGSGIGQFLKGMGPKLFGATTSLGRAADMPANLGLTGFTKTSGILGKLGLTKGGGSMMPTILGGVTAAGLMTYFMGKGKTEEEAEQLAQDVYRGKGLGLDLIKADVKKYRTGDLSASQMFDKGYHFLTPRNYIGAAGGRVKYADGPKKMNQDGLEFIVPVGQSQEKAFYDAIINDVEGIMSDERKDEWLRLLVPQLIESGEMSREEKKELGFAKGGRIGLYAGGNGTPLPEDPTKPINPWAKEGIKSLEAGASSIKVKGDVRPENIKMARRLNVDNMSRRTLVKHLNNMELPETNASDFDDNHIRQILIDFAPDMFFGSWGSNMAKGGRIGKLGGGMPRIPMGMPRVNAGGIRELDYRQSGGFVPMGVKEKADDVPAMLSKNEFVMTADAVRGAGGGSVEKGAQRMYDTMKRLEGKIA